jgi:hypothetical protein
MAGRAGLLLAATTAGRSGVIVEVGGSARDRGMIALIERFFGFVGFG